MAERNRIGDVVHPGVVRTGGIQADRNGLGHGSELSIDIRCDSQLDGNILFRGSALMTL